MFGIGKPVKVSERIGSTDVEIRLVSHKYPEKLFLEDMEIMRNVNLRNYRFSYDKDDKGYKAASPIPKELLKRAEENRGTEVLQDKDIAFQLNKGFAPRIDYNDFRKISLDFLAKTMSYLIRHGAMSDLIKDKTRFLIFFDVIDSMEKGYLAYQHEKRSFNNVVTLEVSGAYLVGRIYAPWIYSRKIDSSHVIKLVGHELVHYIQQMKKAWDWHYFMKARLKNRYDEGEFHDLRNISVLFEVYTLLHLEGVACFYEWQNMPYVEFDLGKITKEMGILAKISLTTDFKEAERLYDEEFSPTGRSGEYRIGYIMCYIIGLSLMMRTRSGNPVLRLFSPDETIHISELQGHILKKRKVRLEQLDAHTMKSVYMMLARVKSHTHFIEMYMKACDALHLKKPVMFIDLNTLKKMYVVLTREYGAYLKEKQGKG